MKQFLLVFLMTILLCTTLLANIINVPNDQPTIQAGINAAVNGDTVLVVDNTYYENINFMGKAITVASYMIMDNDSTHRDNTIINGSQHTNPDSGSVVYFISGEDTTSVIYGFTITGGTGTVSGDSRVGGGIYCYSSAARIINNKVINNSIRYVNWARGGGIGTFPFGNNFYSIIEKNIIEADSCFATNEGAQGGGIYMPRGRIDNNIIHENYCHGGDHGLGGGIHAASDLGIVRQLYITNNIIESNEVLSDVEGGYGGGIDIYGGIVVYILNNTVKNNHASDPIIPYGGGMRLRFTTTPSIVMGNTFLYNSVSVPGLGGGIGLADTRSITILENKLQGNSASYGGGISVDRSLETFIRGNEFYFNTADSSGGGLCIQESNNSIIDRNHFLQNNAKYGGGIFKFNGNFSINNNIIVKNNAHQGGGIFGVDYPAQSGMTKIFNNTFSGNLADIAGGMILIDQKNILINTICWGNNALFAPEILLQSGVLNIAYSDIDPDSIQVFSATLNQISGNRNIDPQFVPGDSLYHLSDVGDTSMCLNTGIDALQISGVWYYAPTEDYAGITRPQPAGTMPDMGAWESDVVNSLEQSDKSKFPTQFMLKQNYPNPFNPNTNIEFQIPKTEFVTLKVYNILGQEVATLVSDKLTPGSYNYNWDASGFASGVYIYKLHAGDPSTGSGQAFQQVRKMVYIK